MSNTTPKIPTREDNLFAVRKKKQIIYLYESINIKVDLPNQYFVTYKNSKIRCTKGQFRGKGQLKN